MKSFINNISLRKLTINGWISVNGDTVFYLAFINYVSGFSFATQAILFITISETIPQFFQIFFGSVADFQKNRIFKSLAFSLARFVIYLFVALSLTSFDFSLNIVVLVCILNTVSDCIGFFSGAMFTPILI
ncbi:MAG: hypothetical protein WBO70_06850 [Erysipelotrichaceae bacterium]